MIDLIEDIKENEGFRGSPYVDSLGYPTIGYGTKLPISQDEAKMLLVSRLGAKSDEIRRVQPLFDTLPYDKQKIIAEMSYQLGVSGVMNFKNMWFALQKKDYATASVEMLNSKWAKQTPKRAKELSLLMAL